MRETYNMFKDGGDPEKVCLIMPLKISLKKIPLKI
jgi:hypothetical protein